MMWIELDEERFKPETIKKIYELVDKGKIEELINNAIEKTYIDGVNSEKGNETIVEEVIVEEEHGGVIIDNEEIDIDKNEIDKDDNDEIIERLRELETRIEKIEKLQHKGGKGKSGENGEEGEGERLNNNEKEWDSEALSIIDNLMDI